MLRATYGLSALACVALAIACAAEGHIQQALTHLGLAFNFALAFWHNKGG